MPLSTLSWNGREAFSATHLAKKWMITYMLNLKIVKMQFM